MYEFAVGLPTKGKTVAVTINIEVEFHAVQKDFSWQDLIKISWSS